MKPVRRSRKPRESAKAKRAESSVADRKWGSVLGKEEDRHVEEHAKELSDQYVEDGSAHAGEEASGEFASIRNPSRRELRKAIVMSEILGLPLALRQPDEQL